MNSFYFLTELLYMYKRETQCTYKDIRMVARWLKDTYNICKREAKTAINQQCTYQFTEKAMNPEKHSQEVRNMAEKKEKRERIEITPEELEQVTGGSFNWKAYMEELAAGKMRVCPKCHKLMYYNFAVFLGVKYWRCLACDYRNPPSTPA